MRLKKEFRDFDNREIEIKPAQEGFIVRYVGDVETAEGIEHLNKYTVFKNNINDIKDLLYEIIEYLEISNDHIVEIKIDEEVDDNDNKVRNRTKK